MCMLTGRDLLAGVASSDPVQPTPGSGRVWGLLEVPRCYLSMSCTMEETSAQRNR